jgi:hypothetical protein
VNSSQLQILDKLLTATRKLVYSATPSDPILIINVQRYLTAHDQLAASFGILSDSYSKYLNCKYGLDLLRKTPNGAGSSNEELLLREMRKIWDSLSLAEHVLLEEVTP